VANCLWLLAFALAAALGFLGWGRAFLFLLCLLFRRPLLLLRGGHTFASRLLLLHWTSRTLSLRLRLARCRLWLRPFLLPLLLLDATFFTLCVPCFTLLLTATSLLNRLLLNWSRRLRLWRASTLALVSHLELLSLRTIRRRIHTHRLIQVRPEPWRYRLYARHHRCIVELPRDSRRNVGLATSPRRVHHCIPQRRYQQWIQHRIHLSQHVSIGLPRSAPIEATAPEVVDTHDCHRARHVEIHHALI
jgi:hypothetical protein